MKKICLSVALFLSLTIPVQAATIRLSDLSKRLSRVESTLKNIQKKLPEKEPEKSSKDDETSAKLDSLLMQLQEAEQTLRQLTGEIETIKFAQDELKERVDQINADVSLRFSEMEKKLDTAGEKVKRLEKDKTTDPVVHKTEPPQKKQPVDEQKGKPEQTAQNYAKKKPKELYDDAFSLIKKQNYKAAQESFEAFLVLYPDDALAGNAQYWLGETFFARSMFEQAAVAFAEGFKNYRESPKAPDNLFKLGETMAKLNKKQEACIAFKNFAKEYPKVSDFMKKRLDKEMRQLSCS